MMIGGHGGDNGVGDGGSTGCNRVRLVVKMAEGG